MAESRNKVRERKLLTIGPSGKIFSHDPNSGADAYIFETEYLPAILIFPRRYMNCVV